MIVISLILIRLIYASSPILFGVSTTSNNFATNPRQGSILGETLLYVEASGLTNSLTNISIKIGTKSCSIPSTQTI